MAAATQSTVKISVDYCLSDLKLPIEISFQDKMITACIDGVFLPPTPHLSTTPTFPLSGPSEPISILTIFACNKRDGTDTAVLNKWFWMGCFPCSAASKPCTVDLWFVLNLFKKKRSDVLNHNVFLLLYFLLTICVCLPVRQFRLCPRCAASVVFAGTSVLILK